MKRTILIVVSVWIILVILSFFWNYHSAKKEQETVALQAARSFFHQITVTRTWNDNHGGVYVVVTDEIQPNPYLKDPLRDIEVNENLKLTKINHAFMTRQLSEIAEQQEGIHFHITSLLPLRPENKPTPRESTALRAFERGVKEVGEIVKEETEDYFFYMAPLITELRCLKCHARQGYKKGDIRGGISISLPFIKNVPVRVLTTAHIGIGLVGLLGILFAGIKLDKAYETIKTQAAFDALTGIPNRRSFSERLLGEFQRSKREKYPLSLIMCDIDNFKSYNDTYGHKKGDECLKTVAQAIESTVTRPGDFCARYGGEEFVVILPNTPQKGALNIAEEIRTNVQNMEIEHVKSPPLKIVSMSLGIATSDTDTSISHEGMVSRADKALYRAKEEGRNCVRIFND